jgi:hypothetical protein
MAEDSRSGGRSDGSGDSDHWLTFSCGNVMCVDFTFQHIHREQAGSERYIESHLGC